jgi:hypothetical protein
VSIHPAILTAHHAPLQTDCRNSRKTEVAQRGFRWVSCWTASAERCDCRFRRKVAIGPSTTFPQRIVVRDSRLSLRESCAADRSSHSVKTPRHTFAKRKATDADGRMGRLLAVDPPRTTSLLQTDCQFRPRTEVAQRRFRRVSCWTGSASRCGCRFRPKVAIVLTPSFSVGPTSRVGLERRSQLHGASCSLCFPPVPLGSRHLLKILNGLSFSGRRRSTRRRGKMEGGWIEGRSRKARRPSHPSSHGSVLWR